eukprot:CAMPEP_0197923070 /NCGR_PEP_ID=MMETSP1439-20131203/93363_1 /TAXON_ID=66791 /ORGANISM="Gonyaulax spinifera, Strain CCMP409" /LENGTH=122 /DNA_ID=CAMNT_0043545415 /DNA_START=62 /DNA_END=427 /DNA_ORIENTATION=+
MYGAVRSGGGGARPAPYGNNAQAIEDGAEPEEPGWTCKGCGNLNYKRREVCNTRKCQMPRYLGDSRLEGHPEGSWICPGCANINYAKRLVCHTRKCGMHFPGMPGQGMMMGGGGGCMGGCMG